MTCSILCSKQTPQSKNGVLLSSQCQYFFFFQLVFTLPKSCMLCTSKHVVCTTSHSYNLDVWHLQTFQLRVQADIFLIVLNIMISSSLHFWVLALNVSCYCYSFFSWTGKTIVKSDYLVCHVCPHGTPLLPLDGFSCNFIFMVFTKKKSVNQILLLLQSDEVTQTFNMYT
jgi:hypothetical protein